MFRKLTLLFGLLALGVLAACSQVDDGTTQAQGTKEKKVILYGWGSPTPAAAKQKEQAFENAFFDGATFRHSGAREVFTHQALPRGAFDQDIADLKALNSSKLADSFLRMQVKADERWDWTSESDWQAFESNLRNYVRTAKEGGLEGILFDPEPYGFNIWNPETQPSKASFEALEGITKQRGADFIRILREEYPGVTVFSLKLLSARLNFLNDNPSPAELRARVKDDTTLGLWFGFVNGMLNELDNKVTLVDGNQQAYRYFTAEQFDEGMKAIDTVLPQAFLDADNVHNIKKVRVANAVFVDGVLNLHKTPRYTGYYYNNDGERQKQLEHNIYHSLRTSDDYAWLYVETGNWWQDDAPRALEAATRRAQEKSNASAALGFDTAFTERAKNAYESRAQFGGKIKPNVPNMKFEVTGAPDFACKATNNGSKYSCHIPAGTASVTITPIAEGVTFSPESRTYENLSSNNKPEQAGKQDYSSR